MKEIRGSSEGTTRDLFSSAEGFDSNFPRVFAPGKREPETEERNTSPLNQIRVHDWRSILSRGLGLIFLQLFVFPPGAADWRRCGPPDFWPGPGAPRIRFPIGQRNASSEKSFSHFQSVSFFFFRGIRILGRCAGPPGPTSRDPRRRLFVKLLFISFIKSSSCPPKEPRTVALDSHITLVSFAAMIYCLI